MKKTHAIHLHAVSINADTLTDAVVNSGSTALMEARTSVEWKGQICSFTFVEYVKGEKIEKPEMYAHVNFDMSDLPSTIFVPCKAAEHGIEQKLRDSLAMNKEDKEKATVKDAVEVLCELWKQLTGTPKTDDAEAIPASWNKVGKTSKTTVKDLTNTLNGIWAMASDEMKELLVKSGQFTKDGQLIVKK